MRRFFIYSFLICGFCAMAHGTDSLMLLLNNAQHDSIKVKLLFELKNNYQEQKKFTEALKTYGLWVEMRDSVNSRQSRQENLRKQIQYEYDKKEAVLKEQQEKERLLAEEKNAEQKIVILSVIAGLLIVAAFSIFSFNRLQLTRKQKLIIEDQKKEVEEQKLFVEEKQKEVFESIRYAKRIQMAQIPSEKMVGKILDRINKK